MWDSVIALVPTVVLATAFFVVLRLILRADHNERRALARLEAEYERNVTNSAEGNVANEWDSNS